MRTYISRQRYCAGRETEYLRSMLALLVWMQSWQIPTAYRQVAQAPQVLSGHTQQAWVGYLSNRAGTNHLYLHLIDTSGYEPLGGVCLSCGDSRPVVTWQASLGEKNWLYVGWSTAEKTFLRSLDGAGVTRWEAEISVAAQELALTAHPEGGAVALLRNERALKLYFWDSSGQVRTEHTLVSDMPCRHARLIEGGLEGFLIVWEAYTGQRWEIFFQKWLWQGKSDAPARTLSQFSHSVEGIELINDGFGGMLGVYESVSLSGAGKDLYLIRYNRNGTRLYEVPLCQEAGDQQAPRLYKRGSELLIVWEDNRHQDWDLYYQRVDITTGKPLLAREGVPLVRLAGPQRSVQLILDYFQNEMIALWLDYRRLQGDIYFQRYTAEGKPLWEFAGRPLATSLAQQHSLRTAAQDFQLFWVVYLEDESEQGTQPHIALLTTQGEVRLHRRLSGNIKRPFARTESPEAHPWGDKLLLLWRDDRDAADHPQLYAQLLSPEGKPLWFPLGLAVSPQTQLSQKNPQVHVQGDTLWLLWEGEESDVETDLFAQALTPEGKRLFTRPLAVCNADRVQTEARWLLHRGRLYAYWTDNRSMEQTGFDLYLRSIAPLLPEVGWRATRAFQNSAFIFPAQDTVRLHHLWQEDVNGKYQMAYALAPLGQVSTPSLLVPTAKPQRFLAAVPDAGGGVYVAFCEEAPGPYEQALRVIALSPTGEIRWQHTSPWGYRHHLYPRLYRLPTGDLLGLSLGSPNPGRWELLYAIFSSEGKLQEKGTLLTPVPERSVYQLLPVTGGFWLLLQMPTGHTLHYGSRLSELKPVKLPAPCSQAILTLWRGQAHLLCTEREGGRITLSPLSATP